MMKLNRTEVQTHLETLNKIICDPRTMLLLPSDTSRNQPVQQGIGMRKSQKWPGVPGGVFLERLLSQQTGQSSRCTFVWIRLD